MKIPRKIKNWALVEAHSTIIIDQARPDTEQCTRLKEFVEKNVQNSKLILYVMGRNEPTRVAPTAPAN